MGAAGENLIPYDAYIAADNKLKRMIQTLFNTTFNSLTPDPTQWRTSQVYAEHKPGRDPELPTNHRPIHGMDALAKIYYRVIATRVMRVYRRLGILHRNSAREEAEVGRATAACSLSTSICT